MAAKLMDATTSFQYVADNVPQWRTSISELAVYATQRHADYVAEYSRLLHQLKTRKRKSDSVASIHSRDKIEAQPAQEAEVVGSPNPSDLAEISPFEAGNRFIHAQANRKRKAGTSLRSNASGPLKFQSKQMVVVYYDSHIQSELDKLVKGLGAARNNLRKGKNAYTAAKGFNLPSLSRRYETFDNPVPTVMSRSSPRLSKAQSGSTITIAANPATVDAAFPRTDKELEAVQSLCETAAHQALRDGDCKIDLQEALRKMDTLVGLAESVLSLLKVEQQKGDEEEAHPVANARLSGHTSTQSTLCEKSLTKATDMYDKTLPPVIGSLATRTPLPTTIPRLAPAPMATDAIEVDDDDSSGDINLNFPIYRAVGRARLVA